MRQMVQSHNVGLFSLLKTKVKASKMGNLYLSVCPNWCFTSNLTCHKNGRIVLAWDPPLFTVNVISMLSQVIHCFITPRSARTDFFCSFIYGLNTPPEREELWASLTAFASRCSTTWLIMGDFNAIMKMDDRIGSPVRLHDIWPMKQCMDSCQLTEVKTVGRHFTWNNKQDGEARVFTRIDRVMSNSKWDDSFPSTEAMILPEGTYDHSPMVLHTTSHNSQKRPFRFFNMWTSSVEFIPIVERHWQKYVYGCCMFRVTQKLKWIKSDLRSLNKKGYNNVEALKLARQSDLLDVHNKLHTDPPNVAFISEEKATVEAYRVANDNFLSFLHQTAKNAVGEWVTTHEQVQEAFLTFYNCLFCSQVDNRTSIDPIITDRGPKLTDTHKEMLQCDFSVFDVKNVLDAIPSSKAPCLDGYNSHFFKVAWDTIKHDFHAAITEFFRTGVVLPDIISQNQGAFVDGRSIMHNILIFQDIIKMYKRSQIQPNCFLKLDHQKAYDTVEWDFIQEAMQYLGFPPSFINLIMTCLTTTQYSIMTNGVPSKLIHPKRGLRQGDPLSPCCLLFVWSISPEQ
ncbi:uncharacterized protein [Spinacia oleracea]|uniref:Reverse transcriptase domain-containing protein n=1 Tax=Spinacia oleracea TaxID=3562 RepID=A0ABM3QQC8_SPIOL|nr:uncharacterized protein LOC130461481 [Spinacia oleracea]